MDPSWVSKCGISDTTQQVSTNQQTAIACEITELFPCRADLIQFSNMGLNFSIQQSSWNFEELGTFALMSVSGRHFRNQYFSLEL